MKIFRESLEHHLGKYVALGIIGAVGGILLLGIGYLGLKWYVFDPMNRIATSAQEQIEATKDATSKTLKNVQEGASDAAKRARDAAAEAAEKAGSIAGEALEKGNDALRGAGDGIRERYRRWRGAEDPKGEEKKQE